MKKLQDLHFPDDRKYSADHGWVKRENGEVRIGISDYAQSELGGCSICGYAGNWQECAKEEATYGTIESVKSVSELETPVSGQVTKVNSALVNSPQLVNESPYDNGWIIRS